MTLICVATTAGTPTMSPSLSKPFRAVWPTPSLHPIVDPSRCMGWFVRKAVRKSFGRHQRQDARRTPRPALPRRLPGGLPDRGHHIVFGTRTGASTSPTSARIRDNVPGIFIAGDLAAWA